MTIFFRFRTKHTNRISGESLIWHQFHTDRNFEYEVQFHNIRIKITLIITFQTANLKAELMPGSFPALPIFLGKEPWEGGWTLCGAWHATGRWPPSLQRIFHLSPETQEREFWWNLNNLCSNVLFFMPGLFQTLKESRNSCIASTSQG